MTAALWVALGLLAQAPAAPDGGSSAHELVFFNARVALREGRAEEVLKLWLLRNALVQAGQPGTLDGPFRSVVWAALGRRGYCPDGFPADGQGAGLWPLALHNQILAQRARPGADLAPPFDALEAGRQQRLITLADVLDREELKSVAFSTTTCWASSLAQLSLGLPLDDRLNEPEVAASLLRGLVQLGSRTVGPEVKGTSLLQARLFDLDLTLMEMARRRAREAGRQARDAAQAAQVTVPGQAAAKEAAEEAVVLGPEQRLRLAAAVGWSAEDWLALNPARRLYLYQQLGRWRRTGVAPPREGLALELLDAVVARGSGAEAAVWVAAVEAAGGAASRSAVYGGDRGRRLLGLDGFGEKAVISLHRGVAALEKGERREALRAFALAMSTSDTSAQGPRVLGLARRWLSFVLGQYEVNQELIATLRALVPTDEYNAVIEPLAWRAALRADASSFHQLKNSAERRGSFGARLERLEPLAEGDPGRFLTQLRENLGESPAFTLRFVSALLDALESEDAPVRRGSARLISQLGSLLENVVSQPDASKALARVAGEHLSRVRGLLEGFAALQPGAQTFVGALRLAPSDPLPWPFTVVEEAAPAALVPLRLEPEEWMDESGRLVFGWRLSE